MKTMPSIHATQESLREHHAQCVERLRCKICGEVPTLRAFDAKDYGHGKRRFPKNALCPCCERMVPPETFAQQKYKERAAHFRAAVKRATTGGEA